MFFALVVVSFDFHWRVDEIKLVLLCSVAFFFVLLLGIPVVVVFLLGVWAAWVVSATRVVHSTPYSSPLHFDVEWRRLKKVAEVVYHLVDLMSVVEGLGRKALQCFVLVDSLKTLAQRTPTLDCSIWIRSKYCQSQENHGVQKIQWP